MKYHIITYGCQMNTADSEEMARPLEERGLKPTLEQTDADVIIMNTCTVRDQAEHRAESNLGRLRAWKKENPNRILVVAGCAATRWGASIKTKFPFIDLVSPATRIEQFPAAVEEVLKARWNWTAETQEAFAERGKRLEASDTTKAPDPSLTAIRPPLPVDEGNPFGDDRTAFVTIMRGCNYGCSYCIVPQVRGREVYRPMKEILDEIQRKALIGKTDVMLLGQTVNSYYQRTETGVLDFSDLIQAVQAISEVTRIRFMSPHPRHMKERVIQTLGECSKVARHIHLPLQSGSTRILSAMKRLYTRQEYIDIVSRLRQAMPGVLVTTDIIVGYPGETEADLADTLSLMEELRFDGIFAFMYSTRPGTASAQLPDDVSFTEKESRLQRVLALNRRLTGQSEPSAA